MRRLSGRVVVAALAVVGGYAIARSLQLKLPVTPDAPAVTRPAEPVPEGLLADVPQDGDALIASVLRTLEHWPNVAALFRQTLHIGAMPLTGAGEYWQRGVGNQRVTCWQWQTLVDGQKAMFTQVYDVNGELWTDTRYPESRTVTRLEVAALRRQLRAALDAEGQGGAEEQVDQLELLARGGLSQMVAQLQRAFKFEQPRVVVENGETLLAVVGSWRAEALKREWPALDGTSTSGWPAHLPHHVVVKVGSRDLFPRCVEYRRVGDAGLVGTADSATDPLARYDFFEIRWQVTMPERLFEFSSVDLEWHDVTDQVFQLLRPAQAEAAAAVVAERAELWRQ